MGSFVKLERTETNPGCYYFQLKIEAIFLFKMFESSKDQIWYYLLHNWFIYITNIIICQNNKNFVKYYFRDEFSKNTENI